MKIIINEQQEKKLIKEYLTKNNGIPLLNYFRMSDNDKNDELIYEFAYKLNEFIKTDYFDEKTTKKIINILNNIDDSDIANEIINGNLRFIKKPFLRYINNYLDNNYQESPAWRSFSEKPEIIKNQWLIHFSDNAYEIYQNGFQYGTDEFNKLAYTGAGEILNKYGEGYNFAYDINDFSKYYKYCSRLKYGNEAIIFRCSGIKLYHYGDEEPQVIFYGPEAKDLIYVQHSSENDNWYIESVLTNNKIIEFNKLEDIVNWIKLNLPQYHKHLIKK